MLSKMNEAILALVVRFQRQDGQALAEYGLLLALIAVVCIVALTGLGVALAGTLSKITGKLEGLRRIKARPAAVTPLALLLYSIFSSARHNCSSPPTVKSW